MTLKAAIVGSGPAGFYAAESLHELLPDADIDIIDRLPTPFGLIRAGVAPDHQSIKNVTRRYEATACEEKVRFIGNVNIGANVTITELRDLYDAVILATGAPADKALGIPGEEKAGVIGASAFVGWYNAHPDFAGLAPSLCAPSAVIIGNGNVALDCARILARSAAELAATDILDAARQGICAAPISDIHIVGRRGPLEAAFTNKELAELGKLERAAVLVKASDLPEESSLPVSLETGIRKNLSVLRSFSLNIPDQKQIRIHFDFFLKPVAVTGHKAATGIILERTKVDAEGRMTATGERIEMPANLVISCIGYKTAPIADVPYDEGAGHFLNEDGYMEPGLYVAGWAGRGPSGTIGTNKPDGLRAARLVAAHHPPGGSGKAGGAGLDNLLAARGVTVVSYEGWKKIEAAETEAAEGTSAPRRKFTRVEEMLRIVSEEAKNSPSVPA